MSTILTAAFQTIQRDSAICFPMLGNLTINPPSYFTVFGFKIYFYGVIIALGFILGIVCCTRICARFGIKEDDMYDAILVIIPTAIIGARLYYVLFELDHYLANPSPSTAALSPAFSRCGLSAATRRSRCPRCWTSSFSACSSGRS